MENSEKEFSLKLRITSFVLPLVFRTIPWSIQKLHTYTEVEGERSAVSERELRFVFKITVSLVRHSTRLTLHFLRISPELGLESMMLL